MLEGKGAIVFSMAWLGISAHSHELASDGAVFGTSLAASMLAGWYSSSFWVRSKELEACKGGIYVIWFDMSILVGF